MPLVPVPPDYDAILPMVRRNIGFLEFQVEYQNMNAQRAQLSFSHCKDSFRERVDEMYKTAKARNQKLAQLDCLVSWHQWGQYEALLQGFKTRYDPLKALKGPQMRQMELPTRMKTKFSSSNCVFDRISNSIILIPDLSRMSVTDIKYSTLLMEIVELNWEFCRRYFREEFLLSRIQYFWILFTIVEVGYHYRSFFSRMDVLDQATSPQADRAWSQLADDYGYDTSYEHPDKASLDLNSPNCNAAFFLPDVAHFAMRERFHLEQYTKFVPKWLSVNHPRTTLEQNDAAIVWNAYKEQQVRLWEPECDRDPDQPQSTGAKTLWTAIEAVTKQTAELGLYPESSYPTPWQRLDIAFTVPGMGKIALPHAQPYGCTEPPIISFTNILRVANPHIEWTRRTVEDQWLLLEWRGETLWRGALRATKESVVDEYWQQCVPDEQVKICHCKDATFSTCESDTDDEMEAHLPSNKFGEGSQDIDDSELDETLPERNDAGSTVNSDGDSEQEAYNDFEEEVSSEAGYTKHGINSFTHDDTQLADPAGNDVDNAIVVVDDPEGDDEIASNPESETSSTLFIQDSDSDIENHYLGLNTQIDYGDYDDTEFFQNQDDQEDLFAPENNYLDGANHGSITEKRSRSESINDDQPPGKSQRISAPRAVDVQQTEKLQHHIIEVMKFVEKDLENGDRAPERAEYYRMLHGVTSRFLRANEDV